MAARTIILFLLRALPAGVFLYAGIMKVIDPPGFAMDIVNYRLVPWPAAVVLAVYLPWVEILAGAGLFVGKVRKGALLLMAGMLLLFLAALASAAVRGLDITCGCFGDVSGTVVAAFLRNSVLLGIIFLLIVREKTHA